MVITWLKKVTEAYLEFARMAVTLIMTNRLGSPSEHVPRSLFCFQAGGLVLVLVVLAIGASGLSVANDGVSARRITIDGSGPT